MEKGTGLGRGDLEHTGAPELAGALLGREQDPSGVPLSLWAFLGSILVGFESKLGRFLSILCDCLLILRQSK